MHNSQALKQPKATQKYADDTGDQGHFFHGVSLQSEHLTPMGRQTARFLYAFSSD